MATEKTNLQSAEMTGKPSSHKILKRLSNLLSFLCLGKKKARDAAKKEAKVKELLNSLGNNNAQKVRNSGMQVSEALYKVVFPKNIKMKNEDAEEKERPIANGDLEVLVGDHAAQGRARIRETLAGNTQQPENRQLDKNVKLVNLDTKSVDKINILYSLLNGNSKMKFVRNNIKPEKKGRITGYLVVKKNGKVAAGGQDTDLDGSIASVKTDGKKSGRCLFVVRESFEILPEVRVERCPTSARRVRKRKASISEPKVKCCGCYSVKKKTTKSSKANAASGIDKKTFLKGASNTDDPAIDQEPNDSVRFCLREISSTNLMQEKQTRDTILHRILNAATFMKDNPYELEKARRMIHTRTTKCNESDGDAALSDGAALGGKPSNVSIGARFADISPSKHDECCQVSCCTA